MRHAGNSQESTAWTSILWALLLAFAATAFADGTNIGPSGEPRTSPQVEPPGNMSTYLLGPGDILDLKFSYNPELNESVTIRPDGVVSLTLIGEIEAHNLSPAQFAERLAERYAKFLRHPEVAVIVRDFASQRVYIGGEVNVPGVVALRGRLTCLGAVLNNGGPKPSAKMDNVLLVRHRGGSEAEVQKLNLERVMKGKAPDLELRPFDVIFVPRTRIAKVGLFMDQYINVLIPRNILFPYNLNTTVRFRN